MIEMKNKKYLTDLYNSLLFNVVFVFNLFFVVFRMQDYTMLTAKVELIAFNLLEISLYNVQF